MDTSVIKPNRAAAIIRKNDSILVIFRIRNGEEMYILPGGTMEPGETPESTVMREVVEETTINAKLGKMIFEFKTPEGREHYLFECSYVSGEPQLHDNSPEKKENSPTNLFKPMWLSIKELPNIRMWPQETKPFLISYFK